MTRFQSFLIFLDRILKILPLAEKYIELQIEELPMKEAEHGEEREIREVENQISVERKKGRKYKVQFRMKKRKGRIDRRQDKHEKRHG